MKHVRWPVLVLWMALLPVTGCGGGPSASKAYDHFVAAAKALEAGDKETASTELSASIEKSPTDWAYFERARIYLEKGQEEDALADCQKGLELDPKDSNLLWLSAELKKPAAQRFKGRFAGPPGLQQSRSRPGSPR
jgi:Tfp pilus assembly protein PilF